MAHGRGVELVQIQRVDHLITHAVFIQLMHLLEQIKVLHRLFQLCPVVRKAGSLQESQRASEDLDYLLRRILQGAQLAYLLLLQALYLLCGCLDCWYGLHQLISDPGLEIGDLLMQRLNIVSATCLNHFYI